MFREHITDYSDALQREMHVLILGHDGQPFIVFPCQDGPCTNWEDFHMEDTLRDYIEEGKIQLFCVDTVDKESWSAEQSDGGHRIWIQECYYHYIVDEVVPYVMAKNGTGLLPITTGFSLGATHAAIMLLRRPDLFGGCLGLSGCYDTGYFWHNYHSSLLYDNSPLQFLPNMPTDHPYIDLYNQRKIILCVGQGRWENEGIRTSRMLQEIFQSKGINAWMAFWGYDVDHDWPWWRVQIRYFLPFLLGEEGK